MANRPTIKDIAREAGVGPATVDRVLNGRGTVREETVRKVAMAAHKVGYHASALFDRRLDSSVPQMTFGIVLHKGKQEFYQNFAAEIEQAVSERSDIRGRAVIRFSSAQTPEAFLDEIHAIAPKVDALASSAVNHQNITQEVQRLKERGIPTFALLNDFAQGVRENYLGLNNMQVGRLAGWMASTAARANGKFGVFVGGNRWHGHELRETGFRSFVRDSAPNFTVLDSLVNLETRQLTYEATLELLVRHPDLRGLYVAGGGMEGAIAALRETVRPHDVALVVNELTEDSRAALADGYVTMVISTPLRQLCVELVEMMVNAVKNGGAAVPGQAFLQPQLYLPESI
ncbi:LacI family DNA-binding transcriptional regulator [Celeribacter marinus]|uniref:Transcriptional regulator, LacI family n=1 Tax=Celeribacter marinus TaxID=1397108 RepID=A0A0N9ZIS0_9RHOB|nr:LacI family DNA-binding transcriptional regulator [Celeribacter marinus]ALI56566.1 transcriptional regulator, LacI family [Celeribacter marinus]SFK59169.1 transcriptional regulator, LacI family [Celeribacter marinus]